jgi:hypothetical protein
MFELGLESKRASNCRLPIEGESVQCFFIGTMFYSSRVSNPYFNFMNHLILLVYLGLDYKQHDDTLKGLEEWH